MTGKYLTQFYNLDAIISVGYCVNSCKARQHGSEFGLLEEHMGLTTWKNAPDGRILKSDVRITKNYLNEKQICQLERAVTGYFER